MKVIKLLPILVVTLLMPMMAKAYDHPEARFGVYGIKHCYSLKEYQENYLGQQVKYLAASTGNNGNYYDEEYFIKAGGSYNKVYTISKITGNDKRMTFLLVGENKSKVKMIINNEALYYSYGKDTYCITDDYTVPLLLVNKFNEDKTKFIGKTFGVGNKYEITDASIEKGEWNGGDSHSAYPRICFVVTDKTDGKKSFINATNIHNINELGTEYKNPSYKCTYTVVGISNGKKYNYTLHKDESIKIYTVKNSISGITKDVDARTASKESFDGDDSGKFIATLSKVEKPSNSSIRYGTTTTVTEKDITKFSYVDNFIDVLIFATTSQFCFTIKNVSENTIKIVWNEAVFVDVDGSTSKIMHTGIKYSQREADQPSSTIIKGAKLDDIAAPTANVFYSELLKEWTSYSLYNKADRTKEGQTIRLMLPIQVKEVINEYIFEFELKFISDHPEYLAN